VVVLVAAVSLREANAQRTSLVTRPSRAGGVGAIQLPDRQRQRRTLAGAVVSVTPWRPGELSGWWLVELAGAGAVGARSFVVSAAAREHVPLREREAITATIDCGRGLQCVFATMHDETTIWFSQEASYLPMYDSVCLPACAIEAGATACATPGDVCHPVQLWGFSGRDVNEIYGVCAPAPGPTPPR